VDYEEEGVNPRMEIKITWKKVVDKAARSRHFCEKDSGCFCRVVV